MTHSPPGARAHTDIRLSPAKSGTLLMRSYDLRGRDGKLVCSVSREQALQGVAAGSLELWSGAAGAYLRAAKLAYPEQARGASYSAGARPALPKGAVRPIVYTSKHAANGQVGGYRARRVGPAHAPAT